MSESFVENGIEYMKIGDYYIPNLSVLKSNYRIGKYGRARWRYIKSEMRGYYSYLLTSGKLYEHLQDIEEQSKIILEQFINQAEKTAPDKEENQIEWIGYMNNAKASAEEIINRELIYA